MTTSRVLNDSRFRTKQSTYALESHHVDGCMIAHSRVCCPHSTRAVASSDAVDISDVALFLSALSCKRHERCPEVLPYGVPWELRTRSSTTWRRSTQAFLPTEGSHLLPHRAYELVGHTLLPFRFACREFKHFMPVCVRPTVHVSPRFPNEPA